MTGHKPGNLTRIKNRIMTDKRKHKRPNQGNTNKQNCRTITADLSTVRTIKLRMLKRKNEKWPFIKHIVKLNWPIDLITCLLLAEESKCQTSPDEAQLSLRPSLCPELVVADYFGHLTNSLAPFLACSKLF